MQSGAHIQLQENKNTNKSSKYQLSLKSKSKIAKYLHSNLKLGKLNLLNLKRKAINLQLLSQQVPKWSISVQSNKPQLSPKILKMKFRNHSMFNFKKPTRI